MGEAHKIEIRIPSSAQATERTPLQSTTARKLPNNRIADNAGNRKNDQCGDQQRPNQTHGKHNDHCSDHRKQQLVYIRANTRSVSKGLIKGHRKNFIVK